MKKSNTCKRSWREEIGSSLLLVTYTHSPEKEETTGLAGHVVVTIRKRMYMQSVQKKGFVVTRGTVDPGSSGRM
jgi:hypothetical protein